MKESGLPQSWQVVWKKEEKKLKLRGEPVLSLAFSWPEIQRGGRGGRRVSQYYRQVVQTWRKRWEKELYCRACLDLSACQEEGRAFRPWSARLEGQVTFQDEETLSVVMDAWEDWGYFKVNQEGMDRMMTDLADLGGELFVMDDGWFGDKYPRNNDKAGLGDWEVNREKLPEGIDHIASYAHDKGLKFGIWIEPEMVSPRSELAEKHPEWIVRTPGREAPLTRSQWLLGLSNPEVQDFVFGVFDNTMRLSEHIDYIKWDANRCANSIGSAFQRPDEQSHFWIEYTQGLYKVMERIRAKYPDVLIQSCASGGGRVEYGALRYFDEVWTSDNTEALSRTRIQYGTSLFFPALVMGSHVSVTPNLQTGNSTPLKFRFDIACAGRLGMELQPKQMTDAEKAFARRAIASYKEYRDIVMQGDLYRIGSPYDEDGCYGLAYVSKDKRRAVVFTYCLLYQSRTVPQFRIRVGYL